MTHQPAISEVKFTYAIEVWDDFGKPVYAISGLLADSREHIEESVAKLKDGNGKPIARERVHVRGIRELNESPITEVLVVFRVLETTRETHMSIGAFQTYSEAVVEYESIEHGWIEMVTTKIIERK